MANTTLDGSSTPAVISSGTIQQLNDGDALFLLGTIDNQGTIFTNAVGTASAANLVSIVLASPAVTLEGGGTLLFSGGFDSQVYGSSAASSLVNVDNMIIGAGVIGETSPHVVAPGNTLYPIGFTNEAGGVIDGNGTVALSGMGPPPGMFINTGSAALVNDGLMEATGIDGLIFDAATIDQSGGGTILASGVGAGVGSLYFGPSGGVDVIGGTLAISDGGNIGLNGATLDGSVTPLTIGSGIDFSLEIQSLLGTIVNLGTLEMTGAGFGIGNIFLASPTVALRGTGEVFNPTLTGAGGNPVTLINVANTISGAGQIGLAVIDDTAFGPLGGSAPVAVTNDAAGVINASDTASPLTLFGGGSVLLNDGLLEATGIGGLAISAATLDQSGGGTLLASGAGVAVDLQNVDLIGGAIQSNGGGAIVFNAGTNTLTSGPGPLVIPAGGTLEVAGFPSSATLTLQAATIDNLGTFIGAGSVILDSPTITLAGSGLVQLSAAVSTSGAVTLINTDNLITNGTIGGTALAMTNAAAGTISGTELDIGAGLTNAGLLENVGVGLTTATTIDNAGTGNLLADGGSDVALYSGDIIGGTLAATGGGSFFIGGGNLSGALTLDGRGAPVTIAAGTTLQDFFNQISLPFTFEASGNLTLLGTIDFAGTILGADPARVVVGGFTIPNAGLLVGAGDIDGYVTNTGTLLAERGTLTVTGDIGGSGSVAIAPGAAFVLGRVSAETVDFRDAQNDRLILNTPTAYTGTLANMTFGDIIQLGTDDIQSAAVVGGNALAVTLADSSTIDYTLAGLHSGASIVLGSGLSELVVACFAEGTRIRTPDGEWRVETLRAGDTVATAAGDLRKVVWVGHRRVTCDRHPRPQGVQPVRIRAHAFGSNAPHCDLLLSQDHAVFVNGVLIPVRYLVNGATIVRENVENITYWHVELDAHDALLAENLPCESYLDTGNRGAFVECDGAVMMHADFARAVWDTRAFAPLAVAGPAVEAARRQLLHQAEALGHTRTSDPDLFLVVDGQKVWPQPGGRRFLLPASARSITIISRAGVPAETAVADGDHRRLGVAVAALRADGCTIALDDARLGRGWHAPERGWRWTDGAAELTLPDVRELDIAVAIRTQYWLAPSRVPATKLQDSA